VGLSENKVQLYLKNRWFMITFPLNRTIFGYIPFSDTYFIKIPYVNPYFASRFFWFNGEIVPTWWFIPVSKWVITPIISGLTLLIPFITGVISHLLTEMNHQVSRSRSTSRSKWPRPPPVVGRRDWNFWALGGENSRASYGPSYISCKYWQHPIYRMYNPIKITSYNW